MKLTFAVQKLFAKVYIYKAVICMEFIHFNSAFFQVALVVAVVVVDMVAVGMAIMDLVMMVSFVGWFV